MSTDLALILAVLSIALDGDPIAGTWSIGGGYKGSLGLLGQPTGIVGTHNRYEGDASVTRGDAYLHGGNVGVFELHKWEHLVSLFGEDDNLTQDRMAAHAWYTMEYSVLNNPYAFWNGFSGLVAPDAHNFVVNFMSNHSAENPGGSLNLQTLMSFWSVTGGPGNWVHTPGNERIPDNWYKRPTIDSMNTVDTNVDTLISDGMYPGIIKLGGNTGTTNSFAGVDTGDLTGGVYNAQDLLQGDKLSCFMLQFAMTGLVDFAYPLLEPVGELQSYLASNLGPEFKSLNCPQLAEFNNELFNKYPGASYKAQGE